MTRSRVPANYGIFQFCCRTIAFVVEICAFATLLTLSREGLIFVLGYAAIILGLLFELIELIVLANPVGHIRRFSSCTIAGGDFIIFCIGIAGFIVFFAQEWSLNYGSIGGSPGGNSTSSTASAPSSVFRRVSGPGQWDPVVQAWSPWYLWLQVTAAGLHFLFMGMHCIDACRRVRATGDIRDLR